MTLNILDKIGDWNPQLFREIKGRLKLFNIAIVAGISLVSQVLLCFYQPLATISYHYFTWYLERRKFSLDVNKSSFLFS
jgi:hypothetical protein